MRAEDPSQQRKRKKKRRSSHRDGTIPTAERPQISTEDNSVFPASDECLVSGFARLVGAGVSSCERDERSSRLNRAIGYSYLITSVRWDLRSFSLDGLEDPRITRAEDPS